MEGEGKAVEGQGEAVEGQGKAVETRKERCSLTEQTLGAHDAVGGG